MNKFIKIEKTWLLIYLFVVSSVSAESPVMFDISGKEVQITRADVVLPVSLCSPRFSFESGTAQTSFCPVSANVSFESGAKIEVACKPIELSDTGILKVVMILQWSPQENVLRKWARFRIDKRQKPLLLEEVIFDELDIKGKNVDFKCYKQYEKQQSYPVFLEGIFLGIEFPVAATRIENEKVILAYYPGLTVQPGRWYETRKAVYGITSQGQQKAAFERYIAHHHPRPRDIHVNYNSWWTSSIPFTEEEILSLMDTFEKNLYIPYGVSLDSFTIDLGWSNKESIWQIDPKLFPQGFSNLHNKVNQMQANLGLWISPSAQYGQALDSNWAQQHGYETYKLNWVMNHSVRVCCLAGKRYADEFGKQLVDMVSHFGIRQLKLDGLLYECPESDHGHAPGIYSSDATVTSLIKIFEKVRQVAPDVWLEACFRQRPSPWWLFYVNSLTASYGDDAPYGRIPAPVYRESYTTARDYFNLMGTQNLPLPIAGQNVLGIIHQTNDPFLNDGVTSLMRGHPFVPLYFNPAYMNPRRWQHLAQLIKWARANSWLFEHTVPLLPCAWQQGDLPEFGSSKFVASKGQMPRQPYGYAHWDDNHKRGFICLRNPFIIPQSYSLELGEAIGIKKQIKNLFAFSIYPEVRLYGKNLNTGAKLEISLAPYETLVLSLGPEAPPASASSVQALTDNLIKVTKVACDATRNEFEDNGKEKLGPSWTCLAEGGSTGAEINLNATLSINSPQARFLVLLEGNSSPHPLMQRLTINGRQTPLQSHSSESGWGSAMMGSDSIAWTFLQAELSPGENNVSLKVILTDDCLRYSVWVWAGKDTATATDYPNIMPHPEWISLDAQAVLEPQQVDSITKSVKKPLPVETINGVFLDYLKPQSATQDWGELHKNESIKGEPLAIAGRRYLRGLGTHAKSHIVYALDGKYNRFEALVGVNHLNCGSVTFNVLVDGKTRWESGLMKGGEEAKPVSVDVTGATRLELIVGDGGDTISVDHAGWADAKLLF